MAPKIDDYFAQCDGENRKYTVPGLCLYLGFSSRGMLAQYEKYDDGIFADVIGRARLRIEEQRNLALIDAAGQKTGIMFDLKNNFGWKESSKTELSGKLTIKEIRRTVIDPKHDNS